MPGASVGGERAAGWGWGVWPLRPATAEAALVVAEVAERAAPFVEDMWLPASRRIEEVDEVTWQKFKSFIYPFRYLELLFKSSKV